MACTTSVQQWEVLSSIRPVTRLFVTDEILSADAGTVLLGMGHINK